MKRKILSIGVLLLTGGITYAQVGINTEDPKATLDVMPTTTGASTAEGFIAPRLTRTQIISKDTQYALPQTGTIVYVTDLLGSTTTKTAKITQIGYYYFDGTLWQPFTSTAAASSNPWNKVGTALPSTLNTDDSYLTAKTVIGGNTIASINGGTNNAQLTVVGEDAVINGITVGKGSGGASSSTAVGASALESVSSSGGLNTAVGSQAMQYAATTSGSNTAIGAAALRGTASNSFSGNTAVGNGAIQLVTTGSQNTAMGSVALFRNTSGNNNTAIGWNALLNNLAGNYNTALGSSALLRTTASDNIGIGLNAGSDLTTGGNNIIIGTNAQVPTATASNQMNIGNALFGITSTSNTTPGRVSIGKTAPAAGVYLDVQGLTQITGANTLRYVDGNQAAGKVLVSDAAGNAVWSLSNTLAAGPWYQVGTTSPSTLNTQNSYLTAQAVVGANVAASINGGVANAQLTVVGGDAAINGITVGRGKGALATNTAVGTNALLTNNIGIDNTAVGSAALSANTDGNNNTAVGNLALTKNTTGNYNVAVGHSGLTNNTGGQFNVAVGYGALLTNSTGAENVSVGRSANIRNTTGSNNTAIGDVALKVNTSGSNNIAIGAESGLNITTGSNNITMGFGTGLLSGSADNQINIGNAIFGTAGTAISGTLTGSVSIGKSTPDTGVKLDVTGLTQITGANTLRYVDGNQAAGKVLVSDASGNAVWALPNTLAVANPWYQVGTTSPSTLNTQNSYLTAQAVVGANVAASINGGTANAQLTVVGGDAAINGITVGKGRSAVVTNTAIGVDALSSSITGTLQTAVGYAALRGVTSGTNNTAIGAAAMTNNTTGSDNTSLGNNALTNNSTGSRNLSLGSGSGGFYTGNDNIAIGYRAGTTITSGANNLVIGSNTNVPTATASNQMNIANTIYGTTSTTAAGGRVSIGKTAPAAGVYLDVAGLTQITGANTLRYVDGNQAAGRLLTSDASGNASWAQPNILQSPLFPSASGTSYSGPLVSNINSGISVTLPANSTWIIHLEQLIRFNRLLKTYQSGGNIVNEGVWIRMNWSDTPTGTASGDIRGGQLISAACYPGTNYHMLIGDTVLRNTSASSKTYYLTTSTIELNSIDPSSPITFNGLFLGWSENTLYAIPSNN